MLSDATSGFRRSAGCSRSSMLMVGAPPVVRLTTTSEAALIFGRNCLNTAGSCVGLPSFGLRACRCTIAAPACAAPIAAAAISSGVTGRYGDMLGVWIEPVTAHVMMTLPCAAAICEFYPALSRKQGQTTFSGGECSSCLHFPRLEGKRGLSLFLLKFADGGGARQSHHHVRGDR